MLSLNLEKTLRRALALANARQHEYATLEHLLMALTDDDDATAVLKACAVEVERLRANLNDFLDHELTSLVVEGVVDAKPTAGFQRVIQRAAIHVESCGRSEVTGANVLVALFSERESHAVFFLQEQNMSRLDAVNYISHGIAKRPRMSNQQRVRGAEESDDRRAAQSGEVFPPNLSRNLERTLRRALAVANARQHEYASLEHLLMALIDDEDATEVLEACAVEVDRLRANLNDFLDHELTRMEVEGAVDARPSAGFHRVIQRAAIHVESSGWSEVTGANVLVALFSERESHAVFFLQEQNMSRLDAVNYISHGIAKRPGCIRHGIAKRSRMSEQRRGRDMAEKTIITCAVTGSITRPEQHPGLPITPEQIADAAIDAARAGAAIAHIHVRDPKTGAPSMALELYREVVDRIRSSGTDLIINLTTGPGGRFIPSDDDPNVAAPGSNLMRPEKRVGHVLALAPEICSLDLNTMWFGASVVINTPKNVAIMARAIQEAGVKPELEVFDSGDLQLAHDLLEQGVLQRPALFQVVLGIKNGFSATPATLLYAQSLLPDDALWAAMGIGRMEFPIVAQACLLGGHVRVGLEDNLYLSKGELAPSNAALVERAAILVELLGGSVATPTEARSILGLTPR